MGEDAVNSSPFGVLEELLDGAPGPGETGVILAPPGLGKSVLAVHLALEALFRDEQVLHVVIGDSVDHLRAHYDAVVEALGRRLRLRDWAARVLRAERHRMILSYRSLDPAAIRGALAMLTTAASFRPTMVVLDGVDGSDALGALGEAGKLAAELDASVWLTVTGGPAHLGEEAPVQVLRLVPAAGTVHLAVRGAGGQERVLEAELDPRTLLVLGLDRDPTDRPAEAPAPVHCTLFSGGARGSEETFGLAAERFGLREVNFTFEGHRQARTVGSVLLGERELAAGDVSLVYVSRRLNRTYNTEGTLIRRVLQTLWHMVSRSQQVFVVGVIQADGTVTGGTGWAVELARMWNKELWVFCQERNLWFRWENGEFQEGSPRIRTVHFTGTGTRYLTDAGRRAIVGLFERSFVS